MDRSTPLTLISKSFTTDSIGQKVPTETTRIVYCNLKSVSRSEWVAGGEMGFKPEYQAIMFAYDYEGEDECEITAFGITARYAIYRTYLTGSDLLELYLTQKVGVQ